MLPAAIAITAAFGVGLLAWSAFWLVTDARERKREAEAADRWVAHHRSLQNDRYLRDEPGRPE